MSGSVEYTREIHTTYYDDRKPRQVIRTNYAVHIRSAVLRAVDHMQMDDYGAAVVEVYNARTGVVYAVITRTPRHVNIIYKLDPKQEFKDGHDTQSKEGSTRGSTRTRGEGKSSDHRSDRRERGNRQDRRDQGGDARASA